MFRSKRKQQAELLANYRHAKTDGFNFDSIQRYFLGHDSSEAYQVIADSTYHDLDLNEVFMSIDRTVSTVGQQYQFYLLRTLPPDDTRARRQETIIRLLNDDESLKESVILQLSRLRKYEAYRIPTLIHDAYLPKPSWFWVVHLLSLISLACVLLAFFYPQVLILLVVVLAINYVFHFWNKSNLFQYSETIPQLLILHQVANALRRRSAFAEQDDEVNQAIQRINRLGRQAMIFKWEATLRTDLGVAIDLVVEMIKALFLIEPQVLFSVLRELDGHRESLDTLYRFVGEIDTALSVASWREGLPYHTRPTLTEPQKRLYGKELYHPLLEHSVSNTLSIDRRSVLLTGSNMSGKTTFIRTVGLNVLLGQTFNTCCARECTLPRLRVHSAIRIADDLMSDKSYYFEEVLTVKAMLEESRSGDQHLFLLDELFKGTNTTERIAAGQAVLTYLNHGDNIVLIATHDQELATYLHATYNLYHFTETVDGETISFDYTLKPGPLNTTNAIRILELNQYPPELVNDAQQRSAQIRRTNQARSPQ